MIEVSEKIIKVQRFYRDYLASKKAKGDESQIKTNIIEKELVIKLPDYSTSVTKAIEEKLGPFLYDKVEEEIDAPPSS